MSKEELKDDLKYIKKSLALRFRYYFRKFLYFGIVSIGILLLAFYMDYYKHVNVALNITILILLFAVMIFLYKLFYCNSFKSLCKEKVKANLIHDISIKTAEGTANMISVFTEIWLIKYQYKKRTYKKMIEVTERDEVPRKRKNIDIWVCKYFPKIIYIERLEKNKGKD